MATYTAGNQINRALRLLGVLAEGETPSADMSNDALMALNQMIDSWNTERLSVFSTKDQVFTWPAGEITRTLGPTGDFVGIRPVLVDDATYFIVPGTGVSYGISLINDQQYNAIALKTSTSTVPQLCFVNMEYPNISMSVYPKPTQDLEWHIVSVAPLTEAATLATVMAFPTGYLRAFTYSLAMEIAPEFGVEPSFQVSRIAMTSKRNINRINNDNDIMSMPTDVVSNRRGFNIYIGNY